MVLRTWIVLAAVVEDMDFRPLRMDVNSNNVRTPAKSYGFVSMVVRARSRAARVQQGAPVSPLGKQGRILPRGGATHVIKC